MRLEQPRLEEPRFDDHVPRQAARFDEPRSLAELGPAVRRQELCRADGQRSDKERTSAATTAKRVRLITHAVSLGGVDTLIEHPAAVTHRPVSGDAKPAAGILRLSVGLESPGDLIADLDQALS